MSKLTGKHKRSVSGEASVKIPTRSRRLLLVSLAYLGVVTFWVGPEDSIWAAAVLGGLGALLGMLNIVTLRLGGREFSPVRWLLLATLGGGFTGLAASGVTAALMVIKTAVHSHGPFTDYPPDVVMAILMRAPLWAAAGLLLGAAYGLIALLIYPLNPQNPK
jgi:hypothetical protein